MNFLIIGDIVGKSGMNKVIEQYPLLVKEKNIDFTIANGENSANGKGLRQKEYDSLINLGIDCITMGNHIYYRKEMADKYITLPRLLIPANITNLKGNGNVVIEKNKIKIGVINLIGKVNMGEILSSNMKNPFEVVDEQINIVKTRGAKYVFVDFHAEATAEKIAMGYYLENKVNCLYGTHTHVQTADETILQSGMAYITDVGMTGPKNSVLGLKKEIAVKRFLTNEKIKYECSENEAFLNAIFVQIDDNTSKAVKIERIIR